MVNMLRPKYIEEVNSFTNNIGQNSLIKNLMQNVTRLKELNWLNYFTDDMK
jgi:hypothetical protein